MRAENAVKLDDNLVGFEVYNVQEVVKAQAAGLIIVNKDGLCYDDTIVNEETEEERTPTEQEIFERITKDLADDKEVYACTLLADGWCVQEKATTTMRTNFYVGQKVYLLRDNKIAEKTISRIVIQKNEDNEVCKLLLKHDNAYTKGEDVFATKQELIESLMAE